MSTIENAHGEGDAEDRWKQHADMLTQKNEELKKSEERYHKMIDEVEEYAIILLDNNGNILHWNKGAERIKGYKSDEAIGKNFTIFYTEEQKQNGLPFTLLEEARKLGRVSHEGWRVRKNGTKFWGTIVITALHNDKGEVIGFSKVTRDLTERRFSEETLKQNAERLERHGREMERKQEEINEKNIVLENLLKDKDELIEDKDNLIREKEWLVKEIHHRVKNNLQVITSLLNMQFEFLHHPSALKAIRESRERVQAIATIYQNLYQFDNDTRINVRSYVTEFVDTIRYSLPNINRIIFELDIVDIGLDTTQAVPLGLILNEAITNAIKYAYAENENGVIRIYLKNMENGQLQLKIEDYGKGLPAGMNVLQSNTLGFQLIKLFAEQLDGELSFNHEGGLQIILNFSSQQPNGSNVKKVKT